MLVYLLCSDLCVFYCACIYLVLRLPLFCVLLYLLCYNLCSDLCVFFVFLYIYCVLLEFRLCSDLCVVTSNVLLLVFRLVLVIVC